MSEQHQANWAEAGRMLKDALEQYRLLKGFESSRRAMEDFADFLPGRDDHGLSLKQAQRYIDGPIPHRQVEHCVEWFYDKAKLPYRWLEEWLEYTDHPHPGELLFRVCYAEGDKQKVYASVRKNGLPPLRGRLVGGHFLERKIEMDKAIQWADNRRHPIAVLWGFGGNGKTTIQLKVGEDFVYGRNCPLRWPFDGVVWISALDYPTGQPGLLDIQRKILETLVKSNDLANVGLGSMRPDWLKQEAEKLLRRRRVLILLDNFETVSRQNLEEILKFFSWLSGSSQVLISSRYRLDLGDVAHVLIPVEGLWPEQAEALIQDYLRAKAIPQDAFEPRDLKRLAEVTRNNPKTIITVLGIVENSRILLPDLLNNITRGAPEADEIFDKVIGQAWQDILAGSDRAVLMAKAFFPQPVNELALGGVANVRGSKLSQAITTLQNISFFERSLPHDTRVRTHPLAQDFAQRILHDHFDFKSQAEERWWSEYARDMVDQARLATYTDLQARPEIGDDITNTVERLEMHLREDSPYNTRAAELFAGQKGLGVALRQLARWDETLRIAEITLDLAIKQQNPRLIGVCALKLISTIYRERNEFEKADMYIAQATKQNVSLDDRWLQAAINGHRAELDRRKGNFRPAKQEFQNVLGEYLKLGEKRDIATTFLSLGGMTIELATVDLEEAIDLRWRDNKDLLEAEEFFRQAEYYWSHIEPTDPERRFEAVSIRAWRAVAARVRGELVEARWLFNGCIGQFQSLLSVARLYRELALVEYLLGERDLAHEHEDSGLDLQRQLGLLGQLGVADRLPPHNCYKIIDRMKKEGKW